MKVQNFSLYDNGFTGSVHCPQNTCDTAVIVITGSDGGLGNAQYVANLFAQRGFTALALAYFKYSGLNDTLDLIPLEYIECAAQWLKNNMHTKKLALYGVSKGAEYALSAAARYTFFDSVVAVAPHYCVTEGLGKEMLGGGVSSWTYQGFPLPYLPLSRDMEAFNAASAEEKQMSIKTLYELSEKDGVSDDVVIPVEKSTARILLLTSTEDNVWPSKHSGEKIVERLQSHHYPYTYRHVDFETASHVLNPVPPKTEGILQEVSRIEREYPKECSEARTKAFNLSVDWIKA
ncbi:MAG: hypothetical protein LBV08_07570 [Clostridiales bacterium]|jgi:dienelactone hydrolase|nr:hypothetical protein [Clostridiales bacterium]